MSGRHRKRSSLTVEIGSDIDVRIEEIVSESPTSQELESQEISQTHPERQTRNRRSRIGRRQRIAGAIGSCLFVIILVIRELVGF